MRADRERARTYRAEAAWRKNEGEARLTHVEDVFDLLARDMLPPLLCGRLEVRTMDARVTTEDAYAHHAGRGYYELAVYLPVLPSIVIHEAAHVLVNETEGHGLHDAGFRQTLTWLVRRHYGSRSASRLTAAFEKERLTA